MSRGEMSLGRNVQGRTDDSILSSYSYKTSVTSLLQQLQLESLEERRKVQRLAFVDKILNVQVAVPAASVDLILSSRPSRGTDANQQKLINCETVSLKYDGTDKTDMREGKSHDPLLGWFWRHFCLQRGARSVQFLSQHDTYIKKSFAIRMKLI